MANNKCEREHAVADCCLEKTLSYRIKGCFIVGN